MDTQDGNPAALAPALSPDERVWKVEISGATYGPYTLHQIRQFLAEGRVHADSALLHQGDSKLNGTVAQLLGALETPSSETPAPESAPSSESPRPAAPVLPERTAEITQVLNRPASLELTSREDPATGIFEVLQIAKGQKETRADAKSSPTAPTSVAGAARAQKLETWKEPPRVAGLAVTALIAAASIAIIFHLLQQSAPKPETPQATYKAPAPTTSPAPVKAQAPLPNSLAPIGRPAFKTPPRLVMPAAPVLVRPTETAEQSRDIRDERDRRDARDPRDGRDERHDYRDDHEERHDPRESRDMDSRDMRDLRDAQNAPQNSQDMRDDLHNPDGNRDQRNDIRQPGLPIGGTDNGAPRRPNSDPNDPRQDPQQ